MPSYGPHIELYPIGHTGKVIVKLRHGIHHGAYMDLSALPSGPYGTRPPQLNHKHAFYIVSGTSRDRRSGMSALKAHAQSER